MKQLGIVPASIFLISCSSPKISDGLTLCVAASLAPATSQLIEEKRLSLLQTPKIRAAASSTIARQIMGGVDCDLVILADNDWMDFLENEKLVVKESRLPYLSNRLALISSKEKGDRGKRIAIADPSHVPAGKYAKEALIDAGEWEKLAKDMIYAPDVRTALLWVERGEAAKGIVYESDAMSSKKVKIESYLKPPRPIVYPLAKTVRAKSGTEKLIEEMISESVTDVFHEYGFKKVAR